MATDNDLVVYVEDDTFQVTVDDDGIVVEVTAVGFRETEAAQAAQAAAEASEAAAAASAVAAAASAAAADAAIAAAIAGVTDDQIALKAQVFN